MAWSDFTQATIIPLAGDQSSSASPTGGATADLVSAATNTGGIVITGLSLSVSHRGTSTAGSPYLRLLIDGVIHSETIVRVTNSDVVSATLGGIGAIEVPAGAAVSYTSALNGASGTYQGNVRIAWRHKV